MSTTLALNSCWGIDVMTGLPCRLSTLGWYRDLFAQFSFTSFFFLFFSALSPFTIGFESEIVWHWSTKGHSKSGIAASWYRWYWTNNSPLEAGAGLILPYNYFSVAHCTMYQHVMQTWLSRLEHTIHCDLLWGWEGLNGGKRCLYKVGWYGFLLGQ